MTDHIHQLVWMFCGCWKITVHLHPLGKSLQTISAQTKHRWWTWLGKLRVSCGAGVSGWRVRGLNISFYILKFKAAHLKEWRKGVQGIVPCVKNTLEYTLESFKSIGAEEKFYHCQNKRWKLSSLFFNCHWLTQKLFPLPFCFWKVSKL